MNPALPHATRTWRSPHPVHLMLTLGFLRRGPGDPAFRRVAEDIWRTTRVETGPSTLRLRQLDDHLIEAEAWGPGAREVLERVPALLGEADRTDDFRPDHPVVLDAVRRFVGLRTPATGRVMESLIPAIVEQKVLGADAFTSQRQLLARFGDPAPGPAPAGMRVHPTAERWAALAAWDWHRAGVDPKRYRTAQAVARVGVQLERLATGDLESFRHALQSLPGVGHWTVAEVTGRVMGDADAVPWGDYHLGRTVGTGLIGRPVDSEDDIAELLAPFAGHRGRVVRLLSLSPLVHVERHGPRLGRNDHRGR